MQGRLSIDFEHFAVSLLGDRYYQFCNWSNEREYKRFLREVSRQLEKTMKEDFQPSDGFQKERINIALNNLKESLKKDNYEAYYIKSLIEIIFWILGKFPENFGKKNLRGKKICHLKLTRAITYIQNTLQKANTVLEAHRYYPYADRVSYDELFYKWVKLGSAENFFKFYKENYPDLYLKFF